MTDETHADVDNDPLLTTDQVTERLLADRDLRRAASTCILPAVRCEDGWRFRKRDLDAWIEKQKRVRESTRPIGSP